MSASLTPHHRVDVSRGAGHDQADGFSEGPAESLVLRALEQMAARANGSNFSSGKSADVGVSSIEMGVAAGEHLTQARQQTVFERLERIVSGIPLAERPGHGLVVTHTIPRLSEAEYKLAQDLLRPGEGLKDDYGDLEIIKFKNSDDPQKPDHSFFVYNPGVFAGLQVSLADDGTVRTAGGASDAKTALDVVAEIEQRLRLRQEIAMLSFHGLVP